MEGNEPVNTPAAEPTVEPAVDNGQNGAPASAEDSPLIQMEGTQTPAEDNSVPESYETFTLPEGMTLEGADLEETHELFRSIGLSQENAQRLVDYYGKRLTEHMNRADMETAEQRVQWRKDIRNRPEFAAQERNVAVAVRKLITTPEQKALFQNTWLTDHPAIWDLLSTAGRLLGEDTPPMPKPKQVSTGNVDALRFPMK